MWGLVGVVTCPAASQLVAADFLFSSLPLSFSAVPDNSADPSSSADLCRRKSSLLETSGLPVQPLDKAPV